MKNFILLSIAAIFSTMIYGQQQIPAFGTFDESAIRYQTCSFEPSANAVKLFDIQETEFEIDNTRTAWLVTKKRVRIKILNEKGYEAATIRIPYFKEENLTKITGLKGIIYTPDKNGNPQIIKLEQSDFYKEEYNASFNIINFTFPAVQSGSILEYQYTKTEKNIIDFDAFYMQDIIPVLYTNAVYEIPGIALFSDKVTGALPFNRTKDSLAIGRTGRLRYTYTAYDLPSFQPEPFMRSVKDNIQHIQFYLDPVKSVEAETNSPEYHWAKYSNEYLADLITNYTLNRELPETDQLISQAKKINPVQKRIQFLYDYVSSRVTSNGEQTHKPSDMRKAWENKYGNTTDINLILLNLLKKADVDAWPFLISTRPHGKIDPKFSYTGQLNNMDILATDGNEYYVLDATLKNQSPLIPPYNVLNSAGLLIKKRDNKWVPIPDPGMAKKSVYSVNSILDENGIINAAANNQFFDYARTDALALYSSGTKKAAYLYFDPAGKKIDSTYLINTGKYTEPLTQVINYSFPVEEAGNFLFIHPLTFFGNEEHPFKNQTRKTSIDFGCSQQVSYRFMLQVPENIVPEKLPANVVLRSEDSAFYFRRTVSFSNGTISYYHQLILSRAEFSTDEYPALKNFYDRIYALMAEEIVLKKK